MLSIENVTYRVGNRTLFEDATARINAGHKVALVGRNGYGKSTLMKLILGEPACAGRRYFGEPPRPHRDRLTGSAGWR